MLCDFGSMLQPGPETAAGEAANGAHREAGAETSAADMAAIGEESGGGGSGGNRWPRQETLALLQIRSDMDSVFRDSSHKGPLWDEISRKMEAMGFKRSAKKCREKFENVYKYHKRTKDGRSTKSDGKSYRFFQQLEALEAAAAATSSLPPIESGAVPIAMVMPPPRQPPPPQQPVQVTVLSMAPTPIPMSFPSSASGSPSSSSSTSSDEEVTAMRSKRKRKWKSFFEKLTRDVIEKQEELQKKFLEALEKRENDRRLRDEAWKAQEISRLNREYDLLLQERSNSAAKDSALFSFLHKLSDQHKIPLPPPLLNLHPHPRPQTPTTPAPPPEAKPAPAEVTEVAGSSRWPKAEIDSLIRIRTSMEPKYLENGPKGALWEEISAAMRRLGYNRNAKRCKEKWENINKYFKRMKESNKRRRDDSKTCPYYQQLEELYREKKVIKVLDAPPVMALPEKQELQDPVSDNMDEDDDYDDDDEDEDLEGGYEIVANNGNGSSMGGATAAMEAS